MDRSKGLPVQQEVSDLQEEALGYLVACPASCSCDLLILSQKFPKAPSQTGFILPFSSQASSFWLLWSVRWEPSQESGQFHSLERNQSQGHSLHTPFPDQLKQTRCSRGALCLQMVWGVWLWSYPSGSTRGRAPTYGLYKHPSYQQWSCEPSAAVTNTLPAAVQQLMLCH